MTTLECLQEKNPHIRIKQTSDSSFQKYGRIIKELEVTDIVSRSLKCIEMVDNKVHYSASIPELEQYSDFKNQAEQQVFGGMPIQIGACYGYNAFLNGLEYHKCSELLIALTELILLLGLHSDISFKETISYDSSNVEAFYLAKGKMVEVFPTTLHFTPVQVWESSGFKALIILPKGTNEKLSFSPVKEGESRLLAAANKWLLVHPDLNANTLYKGIKGENIRIMSL